MREGVIRETSWAWWLLPIFFNWIGGIGAFFAVKDKNKKKATSLMILGFIIAGAWILFYVVLFILGFACSTEY
jgi:Na+/proline symporter